MANEPFGTPGTALSFDHRQLPRWPPQIDLAPMEASDLDAQLAPVAGLRQGDVPDVVLEVEGRIVDPVGHVQAAG